MRAWCSGRGILGLDRVEYPHYFGGTSEENSYSGMAATRDIKHREAILAVPTSLLLSTKMVKQDEELYDLMMDGCPSLFSPDECDDADVLQLTLLLMLEKVKGKNSKW